MFLLSVAAQANQHVDDNYHPLNVLDDNYMEIVFKYLSCEGQPCIKMTKTKRRIMATHTSSYPTATNNGLGLITTLGLYGAVNYPLLSMREWISCFVVKGNFFGGFWYFS